MGFLSWMDSKIKNLHWYEISLIKLSSAASALFIAKLWTPLLSLAWYWYLIIALLAAIKPIMLIFKKQEGESYN